MRPEASETAELLYESLGPLTAGDEETDWHLLRFCDALCSVMLERIHLLAADRDGRPGWQAVFDPESCPDFALPYLGQFVGVALEPELSETEQRAKITVPEGFERGTLQAMIAAIRRKLTGSQSIDVQERFGDAAYQLWIRTVAVETPSLAAVLAAIRSQKPIGIVLDYDVQAGQSWDDVEAGSASWGAVLTDYPDWDQVRARLP